MGVCGWGWAYPEAGDFATGNFNALKCLLRVTHTLHAPDDRHLTSHFLNTATSADMLLQLTSLFRSLHCLTPSC